MKLTVTELEACFKALIKMLGSRDVEFADTAHRDLYWSILSDDWLDFKKSPVPVVGSLDDDFAMLKKLLSDDSAASLVDLERMATVLRLLADDLAD